MSGDLLINLAEIRDFLRMLIGSRCPECGAYGAVMCTDGVQPRGNYHDARITFASEMYSEMRAKGLM